MTFISTLSLILSRVAVLQVLWSKWDIRSFLIASFTFQLLLILAAPLRKRTSDLTTRASLWLCYLLADWVAAQAIGLIIKATEPGCQSVTDDLEYLFSFWAQFLLIHLGGPDTITAFALEDNELWLRTTLHLGVQAYGSLGVLFRSTRSSGLWAATVLMFFAGIIKYLERVMSLFHGRLADFNKGPDKLYLDQLKANEMKERLSNVEMVRDGFSLFQCHKKLFADRIISRAVRGNTSEYFLRRTAKEAYTLLEIQLNFTYEAIYTKMAVIHKTTWKILRYVVLSLEVAGLVIWCLVGKQGYPSYDIRITYALVVGAIVVDVFAFLRIHLSDWSIAAAASCLNNKKQYCWMIDVFLAARTQYNWSREHVQQQADSLSSIILLIWSWFRRVFLRRWSESIHQTNIKAVTQIGETLAKILEIFHLKEFGIRHWWRVVERKRLSSEIWEFIFDVLSNLIKKNGDKNSNVLHLQNGVEEDIDSLFDRAFSPFNLDEDYLYVFFGYLRLTEEHDGSLTREHDVVVVGDDDDWKHISLALTRYLAYLILFQPDMMAATTDRGRLLNFLDAVFKYSRGMTDTYEDDDISEGEEKFETLTNNAMKVFGEIKDEDRWEFLARAWVKLLCYAAIKCRPNVHADKLKQGGEFLSFVWLLMVHLDIDQNLKVRILRSDKYDSPNMNEEIQTPSEMKQAEINSTPRRPTPNKAEEANEERSQTPPNSGTVGQRYNRTHTPVGSAGELQGYSIPDTESP